MGSSLRYYNAHYMGVLNHSFNLDVELALSVSSFCFYISLTIRGTYYQIYLSIFKRELEKAIIRLSVAGFFRHI